MNERDLFNGMVVVWFALSALTFPILFIKTAPYGRHGQSGWGPMLSSRLGWVLMELPALVVPFLCFAWAPPPSPVWVFLAMWQLHYMHRTIVFPLRMHPSARNMPLSVVLMGFAFNIVNGYLNGRWLTLWGDYPVSWFSEPRFLVGLGVFVAGLVINRQSDAILLGLRQGRHATAGYSIPRGGLFRLVSCPNYLGEVLEWAGWAMATWSLPGLAFALWTAANLVPRAYAHHRWYQKTFTDYPRERRAFLPGVF